MLDVSDTTLAATGTNKRMALGELGNYIHGIPRIAGVEYRAAALKGHLGWATQVMSEQGGSTRTHLVWLPGQGDKLTYISVHITTAGDATSRVRLGVYTVSPLAITPSTDPTPLVGPLIVDGGLLDTSTTGIKALSGLSIPVPPQGLWLAHSFITGATPPFLRCCEYNYGPTIDVCGINGPGDYRGGSLCFYLAAAGDPFPAQPVNVQLSAASLGWQTPDWVVKFGP